MKNASKILKIEDTYKEAFRLIKDLPAVALLFIVLAVMDFTALTLLFYAPSKPMSVVLAPIIRAFWGERFLHYPKNFELLPKLFDYAHFVLLSIIGVFITGIVILHLEAAFSSKRVSTLSAAKTVFNRYFGLLAAWLTVAGVWRFGVMNVIQLLPAQWFIRFGAGLVLGVLFQASLIFIYPSLMLAQKGFFHNFFQGIIFGVKNIRAGALLIGLPIFAVFVVSLIKSMAPVFVRSCPEAVLWILYAGIVISVLADMVITFTTTIYFLKVRN